MCEGHLLPAVTLEEPEAPWRKEEEEEEEEQGGEQAASQAASFPCGGVLSLVGGAGAGANQEDLSTDERQKF